MKYPVKLTEYLHGDKLGETDTIDELEDIGFPLANLPRYLIHELTLSLELDEDGTVRLTHVEGQELTTPIVV